MQNDSVIKWREWEQWHVESECGRYRVSTVVGLDSGKLADRYRAWFEDEPTGKMFATPGEAMRHLEEHARARR